MMGMGDKKEEEREGERDWWCAGVLLMQGAGGRGVRWSCSGTCGEGMSVWCVCRGGKAW